MDGRDGMNVRELIMALVEDLEKLFSDRWYKTPNRTMEKIKVFPQFLPPRDAQTIEDPYPYIKVVLRFGGIPSPTDPLIVDVLLEVGIYDDGIGDYREQPHQPENAGSTEAPDGEPKPRNPNKGWDHRNFGIFALVEVLECIQDHYMKHPNLKGFYTDSKSYFEIDEEYSYPYFVGTSEMLFTLAAPRVERSKYA